MDAPLLALTLRSGARVAGRTLRAAAAENMRQLIQLRWIAVAGQLLAILVSHYGLGVPLPLATMLAVVGLLVVANLLFAATLRRTVIRGEISLALLLDMAALTALLYFSGGSANPFISLYLMQVVIGAILLPTVVAGLLAAAACGFYAFLTLHHWPLALPASAIDLLQAGRLLAFAMVAVLLVLFIARTSRNLRARDTYLAELRQRAAEEEGIVRMGLFASGAAHELGTPLSTLSVLVADWQRLPEFGNDPALSQELSEAKAEVDRCKAIVSNILHSAGQERGEAMASIHARAFLDDVAQAWADAHLSVPFDWATEELSEVRIAGEPALRQAIWSLLENASEASPQEVRLAAHVQNDVVSIVVLDRGPGFSSAQLEKIGRLYQSTKGPGHGLGLFLAANVARQLGGSLSVANRPDGGAVVTLSLPLASTGNRE